MARSFTPLPLLLLLRVFLLGNALYCEAFAPSRAVWGRTTPKVVSSETTSQLRASPLPFDPSSALSSSHWLLSTIDGDIAAIPENEFAPIFAGGILVMFGGLISAVIVGLILEKKDLYASVVADSYAQGAEDEEFWKGLSEEETKKAREILNKLKQQNNKDDDGASSQAETAPAPAPEQPVVQAVEAETPSPGAETASQEPKKEVAVAAGESKKADMFSDY